MAANFPLPSKASLVQQYVGKSLQEIPLPAAVVDIAAVKRNCLQMRKAASGMGFALRPRVDAHKTAEITRLQVQDDPEDIRLLVGSISEAENLLPLLLELQAGPRGRPVNILYGVPISPSQVERIAAFAKIIGKQGGNIRLLVDHTSQIPLVQQVSWISGYPSYIYISVDLGDHHAGVLPQSPASREIFHEIELIMLQEAPSPSSLTFVGFYCVASEVHVQRDRAEALEFFEHELSTLIQASPIENIRLSLSATPIMIGFPQLSNIPITDPGAVAALSLRTKIHGIRDANHQIEVHTGNWPLLDIQEGAMHQPLGLPPEISSFIGNTQLRILTEVVSVYPDRGPDGKPEALVGVGKSVLSQTLQGVPRAPLKYHGMATVLREHDVREPGFARPWDVRKVNQESAVLSWHHNEMPPELDCGQRILIHPVDAASASESFGWYVVVDSSRVGREEEIVDVFVRWKG